jgi:hypothetical protein
LALSKLTDDVAVIQTLSDTPNATEGLTSTQLKAKFDEAVGDIKTYINNTLTTEVDALDAANVKKTGDQTVAGVKTFSSFPVTPSSAPTTDYQAANKKYIDDNFAGVGNTVNLTGDQTVAGTKTFSTTPIVPVAAPTQDTEVSNKKYVDDEIAGVVLGQIPDNSLTEAKMANEMKKDIVGGVASYASVNAISNKVYNNEKGVNELLMLAEIDSKVIGDNNLGKYYAKAGETFSYSSGDIDFTKAYCASATQGTNTITVASMITGAITDLVAGMEVTLQDGTNKENLIVQSVADPVITFTTNIANTYAGSVNVYRSNITDSGTEFDFGTLTTQTSYDRTTPVQVVGSAYSTAGNGGRKLVRLSNGWLVAGILDTGTPQLNLYLSDDNGATWTRTGYYSVSGLDGVALTSIGNVVHFVGCSTANGVKYGNADMTIQTDTAISTIALESSWNDVQEPTITNDGTNLYAAWASKNATYPNSFNIRYSKSTDGGATWDSVTQVTTINVSGSDYKNPCIVFITGTKVGVLYDFKVTSSGFSQISFREIDNGALGSQVVVHSDSTYTQANPCATVTSDGDIHVVWHGKDATDSTVDNIRYSKSTDNGVTWASETKLTTGNTYFNQNASIGFDSSNNLYVMFQGKDASSGLYYRIKQVIYTTTWSSVNTITTNTTGSSASPSICENFNGFTEPLTIWLDNQDTDVKFYGEWTVTSESDTLTEVDVRMNITPKVDSQNLSAFLFFNDSYSSITAKASIVDSTANESYSAMTSSDVDLGTDLKEKTSTISVATAEDRVTLKYELARTLTTDDAEFTKVYGGVD